MLPTKTARNLSLRTSVHVSAMTWFARYSKLKWSALAAALLAVAIAMGYLEPDILARYKRDLAASGEELSVVRLSPLQTKEAVGFYGEFSAIAARIAVGPIHCGALEYMGKSTNRAAIPLWTKPEPDSSGKGTWDELAAQMKRSDPAFVELRRLLTKPPAGTRYDPADPLNTSGKPSVFVSKRVAAQALAGAVINDLHQERLAAAITNLHTLIRLTRLYDEGGGLVDYMIHVSIGGLAVSGSWEALQFPGWTEPLLAALQTEWLKTEFVSRIVHVVEMERALGVLHYAEFRTNTTESMRSFGLLPAGSSAVDELYSSLYPAFWASVWSKADELRFLETTQPLVSDTRLAMASTNYQELRAAFTNAAVREQAGQSKFDHLRYPVSSMVVPRWAKASTAVLKYETHRQMAITAVALKRHQLKQGKLPADLSALVPDSLPALPRNFLSSDPLIYERLSDEQFTLRSFGENGQDDRGGGDDLLWPAARFQVPGP